MNTKLLGSWGEETAANYLKRNKYKIIGMNYKTRFGEIDIIAEDKKYIVFVEVKLRKNDHFAKAMEYVDKNKQRRITTTAGQWLAANQTSKLSRFDVIEIYAPQGVNTIKADIRHYKNAFEAV